MKCKNIQVQMSSGSWKCWRGVPEQIEDCDHVNWGGEVFSGEGCSVRGRWLGEMDTAPGVAS